MKSFRLPKEFAEKWLSALRSGNYKQGAGQLISKDREYCCLGVACHLISPKADTGESGYIQTDGLYSVSVKLFNKIPPLLRGGLENPFVETVSTMNDTGKAFPEIAEWVENNVEFI